MKKASVLLALVCSIVGSVSCASDEEFDQRMENRNRAYSDYNDRRTKRLEARQERTDMWFDRHMN
jgi:outer membrane lipoprotein-sorting protein